MKSVLWLSCSRLSCANADTPAVVLCLTDTGLVVSPDCIDTTPEPFQFTTIDATITKSWKDSDCGCNPGYRYLFQYDETDLVDPTTSLTTAQISGVFCKGCLTDWVEEQVGNEVTLVNNNDGTLTLTSQHGCSDIVSVSSRTVVPLDESIVVVAGTEIGVHISADSGNTLSLHADGLYADPTSVSSGNAGISVASGHIISAVVSPDANNTLSLHGNGLYAISQISSNLFNTVSLQSNGLQGSIDWVELGSPYTYLSSITVTVPSDAQTIYRVGDRIRLKQGGGYKYFYVLRVNSATILTLFGGTDYTVANAAITNVAISRVYSPFGMPDYFNYAPSVGASAGSFHGTEDVHYARAALTGNMLELWFNWTANLNDATALYLTIDAIANWDLVDPIYGTVNGQDAAPYNGTAVVLTENTSSKQIRFYKADGVTHWALGSLQISGYFKSNIA